jgi:hypothetical protein
LEKNWNMSELNPDDQLVIERLGGLAGVGLPGSHIRSRASVEGKALSTDERRSVAALFATPSACSVAAEKGADGFRYRLTLHRNDGSQKIEVSEAALLVSLQQLVQDELI